MNKFKKKKQCILHYSIAIFLGVILTIKAIYIAYDQRGYLAVGGEYLILPIIILSVYMGKRLFFEFIRLMSDSKDEGE